MKAQVLAAFLIQPYLFTLGGDGLGLSWQYRTVTTRSSQVKLLHNGRVVATIPSQNDQGLQTVQLPLPACGFGSDYSYQVAEQAAPVPIAPIPCANDPGTTRFSFISDSQEGPDYVRRFASEMRRYPAMAIVHAGDLVQTGGEFQDWVDYFDAMSDVGGSRTLVMAVGNHEYRGATRTARGVEIPAWKHFFKVPAHDNHYAIELGHARVIVLNSCFEDDPTLVDSQLDWLTRELAKPAEWRIVVFHHPPYAVGIANNPISPRKEWKVLQEKYVPIFEAMGADLVLNGHTHIFERSKKNGVNYLTAGPAGGKMGLGGASNPYSLFDQHVRTMTHFELDGRTLRAVSFDIDGRQLDYLTLNRRR